MISNLNYLLVTTTCFVSVCTAIRVDWNTNKGPIIPPTPTTTVRPVPPFREPAPVWEDQSNDIPNPRPYIYVPPPPSRPKQRLNTNINYNYNNNNNNIKYGSIVTPQNANTYYQPNYYYNNNNPPRVASLSPQYIPNVGIRYVAVVPQANTVAKVATVNNNKYGQASAANAISPIGKPSYKLHGKYNAKTKKFKAYEKVKYVPLNYYYSLKPSTTTTTEAVTLLETNKHLSKQELPAVNIKHQWSLASNDVNTPNATHNTYNINAVKSSMPTTYYSKFVYPKDTTVKQKKNFIIF